jgi:hypothetical protein
MALIHTTLSSATSAQDIWDLPEALPQPSELSIGNTKRARTSRQKLPKGPAAEHGRVYPVLLQAKLLGLVCRAFEGIIITSP